MSSNEVQFELRHQKITPGDTVMDGCMMFGDVVLHISGFRAPLVAEFALGCTALQPMELHVHAYLSLLLAMLLVTMPSAVVLSVCIGVGG